MLTIGEASAVNVLADFMLGRTTASDKLRTTGEAEEALRTLARSAHKKLMAGVDERDVTWLAVKRQGIDCTCDDDGGCSVCYAEADELVGKLIRDDLGRIWTVTSVGTKDDFPTIDGGMYWSRPDDVEVLEPGEHYCQNCSWHGPESDLREIRDFNERVMPGEPCPSGECPECDALCQPVPETT